MDGIHDVGGKLGFGKIFPTDEDLPFPALHDGRMLGIARAISRPADWNSDKFRHTRELEDPVQYLTRTYFDQWYKAYACMLVGSELVAIEELATGKSQRMKSSDLNPPMTADDVARIKKTGTSFERPYDDMPKFHAEDRVRARKISPTGHCRLPAYVRGHMGEITACHGAHVLADVSAHNQKAVEPLYTVRFRLSDLFPERSGSVDLVHLDLWESHLEIDG
jgi:nitrile hydratase subunit beta